MSLSLLDLPAEVLIQIFGDPGLPVQQVYSLALLCRGLHFTALPVYFSRNGINSQTQSCRIEMRADRRDLLAAFRIALVLPLFQHLTLIFPHPSCTSIFPFLGHMKRVEGFLSRLSSVQTVCLQLDTVDNPCLSVGSDTSLRAWASHLGDLLNCVLEKECISLTVTYGRHFTNAYEVPATDLYVKDIRCASWFSRLIPRRRATPVAIQAPAEFQRVAQQGHEDVTISLPRRCSRASRLTSLHIQSLTLIVPPGLSLTLDVLRRCPISHLSFSNVPEVAGWRRLWHTVLPLLASAARYLRSVAFLDGVCVPNHAIVGFIAQLPSLTHLDISTSEEIDGATLFRSDTNLPNLTRLRATPYWVRCYVRAEGSLPALRTVVGVCSSFHIRADIALVVRALDAHPRTPAPVLGVAVRCAQYDKWDGASVDTDELEGMHACLDRVEHLEMTIPNVAEVLRDMPSRVGLFRRARSVAIAIEPPEPDIATLARQLADSIAATDLLYAIQVNGETYPLVA